VITRGSTVSPDGHVSIEALSCRSQTTMEIRGALPKTALEVVGLEMNDLTGMSVSPLQTGESR
jgi:hypothetical protein